MTQPGTVTPYSSAAPLFGVAPSWVPSVDIERVQSYNAYDDMFWNNADTLRIIMRGTEAEEDEIYLPTPRTIIETVNRYVGVGFHVTADPATGTPQSRAEAELAFGSLFARERFFSRYNANKRFGLVRGDWLWHILADPAKPEGSRLSILPVHPGNYFPVFESDLVPGGSPDKIVKVHLADVLQEGDDTFIRRQTYIKVFSESTGEFLGIYSQLMVFKLDEWFDDTKTPVRIISEGYLPPDIQTIPVYHVPNFDEPGNPYGSSELRGFERLVGAINQAITDEDITLALEGLGVYATDSAAGPIDKDTGAATSWSVYPGRVIQNAANFRRIQGVGSVVPYGDHIDRMLSSLKEASGANDAAIGRVDVDVAESGVALLLHLAPMLAKAGERDRVILDVHNQMLWDLRAWLKAYEGINIDDVVMLARLGDKLPKNHKQATELVGTLMATVPPVLSAQSAREYLVAQGLNIFAPDEAVRVAKDMEAAKEAADPYAARAGTELGIPAIGSETDAAGSTGREG